MAKFFVEQTDFEHKDRWEDCFCEKCRKIRQAITYYVATEDFTYLLDTVNP